VGEASGYPSLTFSVALGRAYKNSFFGDLDVLSLQSCLWLGSLYWFFFFAFAHLAWAARRADSRRCSGVNFRAVAFPPLRPSSTAAALFGVIAAFSSLEFIYQCAAVRK